MCIHTQYTYLVFHQHGDDLRPDEGVGYNPREPTEVAPKPLQWAILCQPAGKRNLHPNMLDTLNLLA